MTVQIPGEAVKVGEALSGEHVTFASTCAQLESVLSGDARRQILEGLTGRGEFSKALLQLRRQMRAHVFRAGGRDIDLSALVRTIDLGTRADGFNVLHDWDGMAERFNDDIIPVDVLMFLNRKRGTGPVDPVSLAILLDYYFFYLLVVLSIRVWDEGDANQNLDQIDRLLEHLHGPGGSGQLFVGNAVTLMIIAFSSYQPEEWAYFQLLERARTLGRSHRTALAAAISTIMGCHLRFGFQATYGLDMGLMRADNSVDYAWLSFGLADLMEEYGRLTQDGVAGVERQRVAEAILNGLCCDVGSYFGERPPVMAPFQTDRARILELFREYGPGLEEDWKRHHPADHDYSPLAFRYNFPHNVLKGTVVDALLWGEPWPLTLNDLLTDEPLDRPEVRPRLMLARTLMRQARIAPSRIRGKLLPVIVYDVESGAETLAETLQAIRG